MRHFTIVFTLLLVTVLPVAAQDTVQVKARWNLIGSVKAGAIPDILFTVPESLITSAYWGYTPGGGYQHTDTLDNGVGYWVKAGSDGIIVFNTSGAGECGVTTVEWGGKTYRTVRIGSQCWLDRNLDVGTRIDGVNSQTNNSTIEKYCYNDDTDNCAKYGGLYQWNEAMQYSMSPGSQGICPTGWHIPTLAELETLSSTVGGEGNALKALGQGTGGGIGTNTSGFSALLAGYRLSNGTFNNLGDNAFMWRSTELNATFAHYMVLYYTNSNIYFTSYYKNNGFSVRCLKD